MPVQRISVPVHRRKVGQVPVQQKLLLFVQQMMVPVLMRQCTQQNMVARRRPLDSCQSLVFLIARIARRHPLAKTCLV